MSGAHTQGRWTAGVTYKCHHAVTCEDGRAIALTGLVGETDEAESVANAHLIAAAPEMLEALHVALPFIEDCANDPCYKDGAVAKAIKTIRSAIAKGGAA